MLCKFSRSTDSADWTCSDCGATARASLSEPPRAWCGASEGPPPVVDVTIDGMLSPTGRRNIERCRAADCGLMLEVEGLVRCVGMPGSKCQWLTTWASCLNGEREFPSGGSDCPHWQPG